VARIFISYRRQDAAGYAGRLCDRLTGLFGDDRVFMDVQDIQPGENFEAAIDQKMATCDVTLAVIGPGWMDALESRSQAPEDFVRHELAAALRRNVTVVPVLVGGAKMPRTQDLPPELAPITRRQAIEISDERFEHDVQRLAAAMRHAITPGRTARRWVWAGIAALLAAVTAGAYLWNRQAHPDISGVWIAELRQDSQRPFKIRLNLALIEAAVRGTVDYPTGTGTIHDGSLRGSRLSFRTTHVPQFASGPATIQIDGEIVGQEIHLTLSGEGTLARGIARRAEK
jgi:hypothetical protein